MSNSTMNDISTRIDTDIAKLDEAEKFFLSAKDEYADIKTQLDGIISSMDEYWKGVSASSFKTKAKNTVKRVDSQKEYSNYILKRIRNQKSACQHLKDMAQKLESVFGA